MSNISFDSWWSKIFRGLLDSGDLAKMSGSTVKVYVALKCRANSKTGQVICSAERIARDCGMSDKTARRALHELIEMGYVLCSQRPGRTSELLLVEKFMLRRNGHEIGKASFIYAGSTADHSLAEMKKILASEKPSSSGPVKIEMNITNNVNISIQNLNLYSSDLSGAIAMLPDINYSVSKILGPRLNRIAEDKLQVIHSLATDDRGQS